jgi:4-oxalocrotonate tautomerase family enzyme
MPSTRIETTTGWIADHAGLIAAVQVAIVEGIRIPPGDRDIRILEYPNHSFAAPHGRGPRYTVVEMSMFTGRSLEAKRRLYAALAAAFEHFGVPPADLKVFIHEVDRENWGLGGKAATDIELGFKVDV